MGCSGSKDSETAPAPASSGGGGGGGGGSKAKASKAELDVAESNLTTLDGKLKPELVKINAADNQLTALPTSIGECTKLESLDVSGNELTTLPAELKGCSSLQELLCYKNQLKELPKELCGENFPKLTTINMFNNKLRKLPNEMKDLGAVEEMNIAANKLMMIADGVMTGWSSVTVLNLYDNNLVRLGSLAPLVKLTEVRLYGNNLEEMPKFGSHKELEIVELHKNRISTVPDGYFEAIPALKRLIISNNQITSLPPDLLTCTGLKSLQVQENKLASLPSGAYPEPLETLFLQQNELTEVPSAIQLERGESCLAASANIVLRDLPSPWQPWPALAAAALRFSLRFLIWQLPAELAFCGQLLRVNVAKLALSGASEEVAKKMGEICLAKKGGAYWASSGRKQDA